MSVPRLLGVDEWGYLGWGYGAITTGYIRVDEWGYFVWSYGAITTGYIG